MAFGGGSGSMLVLNDPASQLSSDSSAAAPVASLSAFASSNDVIVKVCDYFLLSRRMFTPQGMLGYPLMNSVVSLYSPVTTVVHAWEGYLGVTRGLSSRCSIRGRFYPTYILGYWGL